MRDVHANMCLHLVCGVLCAREYMCLHLVCGVLCVREYMCLHLVCGVQARIYARAPGRQIFRGGILKKSRLKYGMRKKRLSTREKFKGDLY